MRRSIRAAAATVILTSALVGSTGLAHATVTQAAKTPVKQWVGSVCTGFARWETRLTKLSSRGALADPVAGKAAITKYVAGALKATDKLAQKLESAGVPSVKNGNAIEAALLSAVTDVSAAYETAKTEAAALPTDDAAAFSTAAQALGAKLQTASAAVSATLIAAVSSSPGSALDKAFTGAKACTALT